MITGPDLGKFGGNYDTVDNLCNGFVWNTYPLRHNYATVELVTTPMV